MLNNNNYNRPISTFEGPFYPNNQGFQGAGYHGINFSTVPNQNHYSQSEVQTHNSGAIGPLRESHTDDLGTSQLGRRRKAYTPSASSNSGDDESRSSRQRMSSRNRISMKSKRQKYDDSRSILLMGVPEDYSEYDLNVIMKQLFVNWVGRVRGERIGLGQGGRPRPLKIILRSPFEAQEAIEKATVISPHGIRLPIKKYIPKRDRKNPAYAFYRKTPYFVKNSDVDHRIKSEMQNS